MKNIVITPTGYMLAYFDSSGCYDEDCYVSLSSILEHINHTGTKTEYVKGFACVMIEQEPYIIELFSTKPQEGV